MLQLQCRLRRDTFILDIDVELPTPGVTALFGRSGAGKSTVVALLAGLLRPDEGRIVLNERVLFDSSTNVDPEDRAVGYVFQDARLFPHYSVQGNLTYGQRRRGTRPNRISFDQVVDLLGLANLLERRTFRLSGGERQRVALGRALLSQPQLLLLDEPLASLDSERKQELLPYFERLRDELSLPIIHVTHAFDEVLRIAQHVVLLQEGRVNASASLQEICRLPALHAITGPEVAGSVLEGVIEHRHADDLSAVVRCGDVQVRVAKLRAEPGARVRLFIAADDVAVSRGRPQDISMRNVLPATVEQVVAENGAALLHLRTGSESLLARITPASVSELGLAPGSDCFALFKAVATHGRRFARVSNLE